MPARVFDVNTQEFNRRLRITYNEEARDVYAWHILLGPEFKGR